VNTLENKIKHLVLNNGGALAGIASRERLSDISPSGDPGYLLPSTRSLISFAIPLDGNVLRDYFGKRNWRAFGDDQKRILQTLYGINDLLVRFLTDEGHEALGVDVNCVYRPEKGGGTITDMTEFVPDFSHQYGAVAAGLGRLGWSGNLLTPDYGAAVLLDTVLTSAELRSDPLCDENPCDRCGFCTLVCPVEMMDKKKSDRAVVAGITEEIAVRRPNTCCFIGCGDYHGLSPDGKWSNWSPYRVDYPFPDSKEAIDDLLVRLRKADPESRLEPNPYTDYRAVTFDPDWHFSATCGNCANICWKDRADREENMHLARETGVVVLKADGTREATHDEVLELETPYGVKVAVSVPEYEKILAQPEKIPEFRGYLPKDRKVMEYLFKEHLKKSGDDDR
jgi:epoxyqueuosine reductase